MKKNLIESWITTVLGVLIAIFGFATFWVGKTTLWETMPIWIVGVVLVFADEKFIKGLVGKFKTP